MPFDPFGDYDSRGYLRNTKGLKDTEAVKVLESVSFKMNVRDALKRLRSSETLSYTDFLTTHRLLFQDLYPWAGLDRAETAPNIAIARAGMADLFAHPRDCQRAAEYGLQMGNDVAAMKGAPGTVLGRLAYSHPFLDGNGRAMLVVHSELCRRAGIHVDWSGIGKRDYLKALTDELRQPGQGLLDALLRPHVKRKPLDLLNEAQRLQRLPTLDSGRSDPGMSM